jgi:hypothetical protein
VDREVRALEDGLHRGAPGTARRLRKTQQ